MSSEKTATAAPETTFEELGLSASMLQALANINYSVATPIQARAIPPLLEGRDVLGQAQTGTGKTGAFAIPLLERVDVSRKHPQVLVLAPTRELAIQVAEAFEQYSANLPGLRVAAIYGGQDYSIQLRQLKRGIHVVVGTPGRVMDHMRRGSLQLDQLQALVLDEADEMLKMGFAEDVDWILTQTPAERQTALFSATMPETIRRIAQQHLQDPVEVTIQKRTATADTIDQRYVVVTPHSKEDVLARLLEAEETDGILIFVKLKSTTEPLAEFLNQHGYRTSALSGDVPQKQRERIVENLKTGKIDVIIATDVAARGLDVQRISHVINYDLPHDSESYVHRIGRTGRAGRTGSAIVLVQSREQFKLRRIEQATRQRIQQMDIPSKREVNQRRTAKFHQRITEKLAHPDFSQFESLVAQYRDQNDVPLEQIAAALAVMACGDTPLFLTEELKTTRFNESREARPGRPNRRERFAENDRPERPRHNERTERASAGNREDMEMETFRIEVGHQHQVKPGNIVGAIANETGVDTAYIGRIRIFEDFSTVDLVVGMPDDIFQSLKRVWVSGQQLNISRYDGNAAPTERPGGRRFKDRSKPKRFTSKS